MRHKGADIRKIELPMEKVAAGLRQTLASLEWRILHERVHDGELTIRATGNLSGGFAFWIASGRQLAEWRLAAAAPNQTIMETHYGLDPRFRRRFWFFLTLLASLALFSYCAGDFVFGHIFIGVSAPFWRSVLTLCLSAGFLLTCLALAASGIGGNQRFNRVIQRLGMDLEREYGPHTHKTLQSDYLFPDFSYLLAFFIGVAVLFIFYDRLSQGSGAYFQLFALWPILCLLGVLLAFLVPGFFYRGFTERLTFVSLAMAVLVPVLIIYSLPTINIWFTGDLFSGGLGKINGFSIERMHWLVRSSPVRINTLAFLLAAGNLSILSLAAIIAMGMPALVENLIRRRRDFLFDSPRQSVYRQALEARSFSGVFTSLVLAFWLVAAAILYWELYAGLSVLELGCRGEQVWFESKAGQAFFCTLHLVASAVLVPLGADNFAVPVARAVALAYGLPLPAIAVLVAIKRWTTWRHKLRLVHGRLATPSQGSTYTLKPHCDCIARQNGLRGPLFIVDASPLPALQCFFMGFPYFRSVLVVSRGCLRLTANEIEGLLAHELFHIKRHTRRWYLLSLLSDITFFGTGFLNVLTNTFENELAADRFAVEWLHKHNIPTADYTQALRIVSMAAAVNPAGGPSLLASTPAWPAQAPPMGKLRLLFELYFGDTVASYIHPPLEERIAIIEAIDAGPPSIDESGPAAG